MSDGSKVSGKHGRVGNMTWTNSTVEGDGYKVHTWQGMNDKQQYTKQIAQFDKMFYYAIDHMGAEPGSTIFSCNVTNECTQKYTKHCCVNVVIQDDNTEHSIYRCMNQRVADANLGFQMNGMKVSMKCLGGSGASQLSMAAATTLGLVAMTLY